MAEVASAMARETAEAPTVAERFLAQAAAFAPIVERIKQYNPRMVVFCGRGSSGHVGVYLRYLFETRLGWLASAAAPSVVTAYQKPPDMRGALFIVISQSGRSPDLVTATQVARKSGAMTLAVVNDDRSPAAASAELVLPIGAGHEHAVAATKTVVQSMLAGAWLVAELAGDTDLKAGMRNLPRRMAEALKCDWSAWAERVTKAPVAFVVGRGYGLGCVREAALKISEVLRVPALGYSAAELRHGPRAAVTHDVPLLALRQADETATAIDDLIADLKADKQPLFVAGGRFGTLPWIGDGHPAFDPVLMLLPVYRAIESAARQMGFDPDNPPHLSKITRTL